MQAMAAEVAGCEILRIAIPDEEALKLIPAIKEKIQIPLVADIHFDYRPVSYTHLDVYKRQLGYHPKTDPTSADLRDWMPRGSALCRGGLWYLPEL